MFCAERVQVRLFFLCVSVLGFFAATAYAQFIEVPPLRARVVDQTGILKPIAQELEVALKELELDKGSQVAVLVVDTTKPETIEQFSIRVVDQWKLGRKGVDDGVLLLVALKDRTVRIEVGRGLEGEIPDIIAKRIISEQILPRFRSGDIPQGVRAGVVSIANRIRGIDLSAPEKRTNVQLGGLLLLLYLFVSIGIFLKNIFGRLVGGLVAAGFGALITALIASPVIAIFMGIAAGALVFLLQLEAFRGQGAYYRSGSRGRNRSGGFGSGGFGGGFGGAGGSFGGGGASGRW